MKLRISAFTGIGLIFVCSACKTTTDAEPGDSADSGSGGRAGTGGRAANGGLDADVSDASNGNGGTGNGGASTSTGGSGDSGDSGDKNTGGTVGAGGAGNGGAGAAPEDAGSGGAPDGSSDAGSEPAWLDDLPGPDSDAATILEPSALHSNESLFGLFVDGHDSIVMGGWKGSFNNTKPTLGFVAKLDDTLAKVWTTSAQVPDPNTFNGTYGLSVKHFAGNAAGVAFVGGTYHPPAAVPSVPGETARGQDDVVAGAYGESGAPLWMHQYGSGEHDLVAQVAAGPEGSVYVSAQVGGQLPGKPADVRSGAAVLKYDAAGKLTWTAQYKTLDPSSPFGTISHDTPVDMTTDTAGNAYVSDLFGIVKLAPSGDKLWYHVSPTYGNAVESVIPNVGSIAAHPAGDVLFAFGYPFERDLRQFPLQKWDAQSGRPLWIRKPGVRHAVIDAVEGATWDGHFLEADGLLVTDDAVYLTGLYTNEYTNGSVQRPPFTATFVARYDLNGKQVWFKQFRLKMSSNPTDIGSFTPTVLAKRPNGDLVLGGNTGVSGWVILKLKASDGSKS